MTADIIPMKEPTGARVRKALQAWEDANANWIETTMTLAIELHAARTECGGDNHAFGHWLVANDCEVAKNDRWALVNMGAHPELSRRKLEETKRKSVQCIWDLEIKPHVVPNVRNNISQQTSSPEPVVSAPVPAPSTIPAVSKKAETAEPVLFDVPKKSKLFELIGTEAATVLFQQFKHRIFNSVVADKSSNALRRITTGLRYLAERCVSDDYPEALRSAPSWSVQLLYPHLPAKLLDQCMASTSLETFLARHHATLVATEAQFVRTPEFGMTDPPLAAYNKAQSIYNSIISKRNGDTFDKSLVHKAVFNADEGKPPVIVLGTQLWPALENTGYGYDDLRCAFNLARDVVLTFKESSDVPMTTQALKLRHIRSWLPGGYNSTGSTIEGVLNAFDLVIQAYTVNRDETLTRPPLPSLKKLDE